MKKVFLYAGQGAQRVGMGADLYEKFPLFRDCLDSIELDFDFKGLMLDGPIEKLSLTEFTQPCMAAFAYGVTELLKERGITPAAAIGLSLGEYGALYSAGAFSGRDYVDIVRFRGKAMARSAEGVDCLMSAVLGADPAIVEESCGAVTDSGIVHVANYNCPGQIVIGGDAAAVVKAEEELKKRGVKKIKRLNVSGPFHTSYMKEAGDALGEYLAKISLKDLQVPVISNVTGDYYGGSAREIGPLLVKQVQSATRLESGLRRLLQDGHRSFVEIGPGKTMASFLKKTAMDLGIEIEVSSIDTAEDFENASN